MEHIVQFGISIDDEAIKKRLEESAYDDVVNTLIKEAKSKLPKVNIYTSNIDWSRIIYSKIDDLVKENKDAIIQAAAKDLVDRVYKSKAFKDKINAVLEDNK